MYRPVPMQPALAADFDETLKALANPVRRQILSHMKDPEHNFPDQDHPYSFGVCAKKIDERFELSQSTISAHLATLQHADLIIARKIGQFIFYKRNEPAIAAFLSRIGDSL